MGRKTKYLKTYPEALIEHMTKGRSYKSFAAKIGVHIDTLYQWEKTYCEFSEAKKVAFLQAEAFWEDLGLELARAGNGQVWKMNMKNRFGWRENPHDKVEVSIEPKGYGLAFDLSKHPDDL